MIESQEWKRVKKITIYSKFSSIFLLFTYITPLRRLCQIQQFSDTDPSFKRKSGNTTVELFIKISTSARNPMLTSCFPAYYQQLRARFYGWSQAKQLRKLLSSSSTERLEFPVIVVDSIKEYFLTCVGCVGLCSRLLLVSKVVQLLFPTIPGRATSTATHHQTFLNKLCTRHLAADRGSVYTRLHLHLSLLQNR